jgi:hypothetical protein
MKPKPLAVAITFTGLILVSMWWRQSSLEDEIQSLRIALAEAPSAPQVSAPMAAPSDSGPVASTPRESYAPRVEIMGNEDDRISDLERVVNGQADVLEGMLDRIAKQDEIERKAKARAWGPEQVVGEPDTMTAGDQRTAWAPAAADGGIQWLQADFEKPVDIAQVVVRQTCNPGSITKVVMVTDTGAEVPIWEGQDPSAGQSLADTPFAAPSNMTGRRVKVYLDTSRKPGWEEIDAMQLVGRDGSRQWAKEVSASSTYASGQQSVTFGTDLMLLEDGKLGDRPQTYRNSNLWYDQSSLSVLARDPKPVVP